MLSKNTDGIIKTNRTEIASGPAELERIAPTSHPAYDYAIERTDELDLRYYLDRVLRHKLIVATVTILCTAVAAFFILGQEPEYTAKTRVQVDYENNGPIAGTADEPTTFVDRTYFNTQLELLQSPSLIRSAIGKLEQKSETELAAARPETAGIRALPNIIRAIYPIENGLGNAALASDRTPRREDLGASFE